ncbi:putative atherin-like [Scophthalmus maximus]|uniref:Putative atherin-like n=1 Tax=Scophthalmus maximus TaxID=52904 RepID=A0A2U9BQW2_SCOMX|nr:putative atherin-like [Scophthalmus maximus]
MQLHFAEKTVLKVSYKGSISYRNAAKVQRKSRKKSEFTAAGGAETARERTKHNPLNNNGDSAHSFTDQEEGEDSEPSPDPHTQTSASTAGKKLKPASSRSSGNGCLSCGATTGCAVGSGCEEEKARQAHTTPAKAAGRRRAKPMQSAGGRSPLRPELTATTKLAPGASAACPSSSSRSRRRPSSPNFGLSERSLRGSSSSAAAAPTRGHMKPLGLKEILGYLSSQEQLSEEKLTRGKVKVVMEREVARGRLRRTRCGNITLPLRGAAAAAEGPMPKNASAGRLPPPSSPVQENEPMETVSGEEERGEKEEEEEEGDPRSSDEEGGPSPVAMTPEPGLTEKPAEDTEIQAASEQESPHRQQQHGGEALSGMDPIPRTPSPPVQGPSLSQCDSALVEERDDLPDQLHMAAQTQIQLQYDRINHTSSGLSNSECKTEVGESSCLLTPTASPRDSGLSEEQGINGGVGSGGCMKSEGGSGSPVDWTVSDVVSYFTAAGFPEQAAAFSTQEIDGKSLLLMQRNDVLTGLSIRLGPALKIYERHVKVLQRTHFEEDGC